jgi:hypothetical protein
MSAQVEQKRVKEADIFPSNALARPLTSSREKRLPFRQCINNNNNNNAYNEWKHLLTGQ